MENLQWNCPAPVGIPPFDEQHWELHRQFWRLIRTLETDPNGALPEYRFVQLTEQTARHFQAEEAYLQAAEYPGLASHRADHRSILEKAREDLVRWHAPGAPPLSDLVEAFAQATQRHLESMDREFAAWMEAPHLQDFANQ